MKLTAEKLQESGSVDWREEYETLLRKYGLEEAEEEEPAEVSSRLEEEDRRT